jgi:hypothetical protein
MNWKNAAQNAAQNAATVPAIFGIATFALLGSFALAQPPLGAAANARVSDGDGKVQDVDVLARLVGGSQPAAQETQVGVKLDPGAKWPTDKRTVERLKAVSEDLGKPLWITSGKRELGNRRNPAPGTQWYFWNKYQAGRGNLAAYPNPNAPHIVGYAADVVIEQPDGTRSNVGEYVTGRRLLRKHGLVLSVRTEAWHVAPEEVNRWAYRP